jgi:hypothetical protein
LRTSSNVCVFLGGNTTVSSFYWNHLDDNELFFIEVA